MQQHILDQPLENESRPVMPWRTSTLWAFLTLTISNILFYYVLLVLDPFLMGLVADDIITAGRAVALKSMLAGGGVFLLSLVIGNWWGKALSRNQEIPEWQIFVLAFTIALFSVLIRMVLMNAFRWFDGDDMKGIVPMMLFGLGFHTAIFTVIVFLSATFRRGSGIRKVLLTVGVLLFMGVFLIYLRKLLLL